MECDYRNNILRQLKTRNSHINVGYAALFAAYNDLLINGQSPKHRTSALFSSAAAASNGDYVNARESKIFALIHAEFTDLQRELKEKETKQVNAFDTRLHAKDVELIEAGQKLKQAQDALTEMAECKRNLEQQIAELKETNQHLIDEMLAVHDSYHELNEKYRLIKEEKNLPARDWEVVNTNSGVDDLLAWIQHHDRPMETTRPRTRAASIPTPNGQTAASEPFQRHGSAMSASSMPGGFIAFARSKPSITTVESVGSLTSTPLPQEENGDSTFKEFNRKESKLSTSSAVGSLAIKFTEKNRFTVSPTVIRRLGDEPPDSKPTSDGVPSTRKLKFPNAHNNDMFCIGWSSLGRYLATGGADKQIKLWSLEGDMCVNTANLTGCDKSVSCLNFDGDQQNVLGGSFDHNIRMWSLDFCQQRSHALTGHGNKVLAAKFMDRSTKIVSGSSDRTIRLWDLRTGICTRILKPGSTCSDVVPRDEWGDIVISGHLDKKLRLYDVRAPEPLWDSLFSEKITSLDLASDRTNVLVCTRDDVLHRFDVRMERIVSTYSEDGYITGFDYTKAVFSPDGQFCASGSANGQLFIWNVLTEKLVKKLGQANHYAIIACAWHPFGHMIVTCDKQRTITVWEDIV